jgi:hypothetical protein
MKIGAGKIVGINRSFVTVIRIFVYYQLQQLRMMDLQLGWRFFIAKPLNALEKLFDKFSKQNES